MIKAILGRLNNEAKFLKKQLKNSVAPLQPLQTNVIKHVRNIKAEAILRRLKKEEALPQPPRPKGNNGVTRSVNAAGVGSYSNRTVHDLDPERLNHSLSFARNNTVDEYDSLEPRKNISPDKAKLRQANIKYQNGILLNEVQPGDKVTATPITSENGRNPRAAMYDRMTKGALKSKVENLGTKDNPYFAAEIKSSRGGNNRWTNALGERKTFDPNSLKKPLEDLAKGSIVKRLVGANPYIQGAMLVNDVVGQATGTKPSDKVQQEFLKATANSIEERMKRGQRFSTPIPFRF